MSSSAPRCFVHIGAPKTGTTFLQRFFFENRNALSDAGVLYPDVSLRGYGHHDLAFLLHGGYPDWASPQPRSLADLKADFARQVQGATGNILISSEDFYLFPAPEDLHVLLADAGALDGRDAVIVVYLRRQDHAHESWYNQTIKAQGYDHDLSDCIRTFHDLWDYRAQLDRWEKAFGRDALVVRVYEERQFIGGSLLNDFLSILDLAPERFPTPGKHVNSGLNKDLLDFQRRINRLPLSIPDKRRFHKQLIELSAQSSGTALFDETPLISGEQALEILRTYAEANADVARRYLNRRELFSDTLKTADAAPANPTGLTPEKMTYILAWLMMGTK